MKRALAARKQIPALLLDSAVLTASLTQVEGSVREILSQAQAPQNGATSRNVGVQDPWQPRTGFGTGFAQDLSQRFHTAAGT